MNFVAVVCNALLFLFTGFVLLTDGVPRQASYIVFTLWVLLTLILSAVVISRIGASDGWLDLRLRSKVVAEEQKGVSRRPVSRGMRIVTIVANGVLFGFICWAVVDTYPHLREEGFIPYVVLMVLTPIFSLAALFRSGTGWRGAHLRRRPA